MYQQSNTIFKPFRIGLINIVINIWKKEKYDSILKRMENHRSTNYCSLTSLGQTIDTIQNRHSSD